MLLSAKRASDNAPQAARRRCAGGTSQTCPCPDSSSDRDPSVMFHTKWHDGPVDNCSVRRQWRDRIREFDTDGRQSRARVDSQHKSQSTLLAYSSSSSPVLVSTPLSSTTGQPRALYTEQTERGGRGSGAIGTHPSRDAAIARAASNGRRGGFRYPPAGANLDDLQDSGRVHHPVLEGDCQPARSTGGASDPGARPALPRRSLGSGADDVEGSSRVCSRAAAGHDDLAQRSSRQLRAAGAHRRNSGADR